MQLTVIPEAAPVLLPPIDLTYKPRRRSLVESATQIAAGVVAAVRADKAAIKRLEAKLEELQRRNSAMAQEIADLHAARRQRWTAAQRQSLAAILEVKHERRLTYAQIAAMLTDEFARKFNARQVGDAARRIRKADQAAAVPRIKGGCRIGAPAVH